MGLGLRPKALGPGSFRLKDVRVSIGRKEVREKKIKMREELYGEKSGKKKI